MRRQATNWVLWMSLLTKKQRKEKTLHWDGEKQIKRDGGIFDRLKIIQKKRLRSIRIMKKAENGY